MSLPHVSRRTRAPAFAGAVATVLLIVACGGTAVAKSVPVPPRPPGAPVLVPKGPSAARHIALESAAFRLINRASRRAFAMRPSCKPSFPHPSSKTTRDTPGRPVLDAIAALRRPTVPADAFPAREVGMVLGEVYVDYTRSVTSVGGKSFYIVVTRNAPVAYRPSAACLDAQHTQLVKLLRGKPAVLRSTALVEFGKIRRVQERSAAVPVPTTPQDGLWFFTKGPGGIGLGGGGGGGAISDFLENGMFFSSGRDKSATLVGLVPDGVATVTLHYPRTVSRGRW